MGVGAHGHKKLHFDPGRSMPIEVVPGLVRENDPLLRLLVTVRLGEKPVYYVK